LRTPAVSALLTGMRRRSVLRTAIGLGAVATGTVPAAVAFASADKADKKPPAPTTRDIVFRRWTTDADFGTGAGSGTTIASGSLSFGTAAGQLSYTDPFTGTTGIYDYATWTSAEIAPGFNAQEIIPSWIASTPGGSWVQIELRGITATGTTTKWYTMGRWAADDGTIRRTSVPTQGDTDGFVAIDTFVAAAGHEPTSYRLRVTLLRPAGSSDVPVLHSLGAVASRLPDPDSKLAGSTPQTAQGITIDVPRYSQDVHLGQYPEYDGGGEAWCSPTSTSMILGYWGHLPPPADYAWVDPSYADPWVDQAARGTFDANYTGCGNWPFNTAYAGRYGMDGFVTRLRSMNEAEKFIAAGLPLVVSASFKKGEIPGLTYGTNGHLLVLVGFTATGDPILNDPASLTDADVRKPVGRLEFERAWLNTSRGVVYVIHPFGASLPAAPAQANW